MSLQYLAPISASSLSEYYRNIGYQSFIVYDDLSLHAIAYRQLSLSLGTSCLNLFRGFGSIACLPVIETLSNDLSAYIATNVI